MVAGDCYRGRADSWRSPTAPDTGAEAREEPQQIRLRRATIQNTLTQNNLAFWACVNPRGKTADGDGYVATRFRIAADGSVAESRVVSAAGVGVEVEDCVGRALCLITFPKPSEARSVDIEQSFRIAGSAIAPLCYIGHREVPPVAQRRSAPGDGGAPATLAAKGSLDKDLIRDEIRRHVGAMRACYEAGLATQPNLKGRVNTQLVITTDGTVSFAGVTSSTMNASAVEDCIGERFCSLQFPRPNGGGIVIVSYPFNFATEL